MMKIKSWDYDVKSLSFWKLEDVGELVHEASLLPGLLLQVQIQIIQVAGAKQFQQFTSVKQKTGFYYYYICHNFHNTDNFSD